MTTVTWNSGATGDWSDASNWSPESVPGAGDTAIISAGTADLLSGVDPASDITILLGGPTVTGASGGVPDAYLYTLNNNVADTVANVTPGTEGVWASEGITNFTGSIELSGSLSVLVLGIDSTNPGGIKEGPNGAGANTVANPAGLGEFENQGTISASDGSGLIITPLNTLDDSQVSMLIGTINLNDADLASTYVTLGPPEGGFGTSGVINLANNSRAAITEASDINVNFQDGNGDVLGFTTTNQTAVITGFRAGDTIEQTPQSVFGVTQDYGNEGISYNTATHVLQITTGVGGTPYLDYTLDGSYSSTDFQASDDSDGNLVITMCFAAGTRIATDRGEVAVEALHAGDRVATARRPGAACREVQWIGHREIDLRRHPNPDAVRPIRVREGAFGALPRRDLLLSPDHALFLAGVLVPVRYLVDGTTILPDADCTSVTYFHVELATHDVLLAEGLPAESYLDTGNRRNFANGGASVALHADFGAVRTWERDGCAPLRGDGPEVAEIRRQLLARALAYGFTIEPGRELWLEGAGRRVDPAGVARRIYRFVLPEAAGDITIRSRAGVPAHVDPRATDRRRLGAMIERVVLRRGRRCRVIAPGDGRLAAGFYAPEQEGARRWRWTDGSGVLPAAVLPPGKGPLTVELHVGDLHPWWSDTGTRVATERSAA